MATTSALVVLPPSSSAPIVLPFTILVAVSPSLLSHPCVSLDHLYISSDADSLWSATYKPEQKTPIDFVSAFDKNLIKSAGVQNAMDSAKVFL